MVYNNIFAFSVLINSVWVDSYFLNKNRAKFVFYLLEFAELQNNGFV